MNRCLPWPLLNTRFWFWAVILALAAGCAGNTNAHTLTPPAKSQPALTSPQPTPAYWPTTAWRSATPESQGMDSVRLAHMLDHIRQQEIPIHSLIVVRHGYIVAEANFYPYRPDLKHRIYSCSKSVISALVGIALDQDHIDRVDQPALDFFPDRIVPDRDSKQAITLEHLLAMTSGLDWPSSRQADRDTTLQMFRSPDWVQFTLNRPAVVEPGREFRYNSGGSHLLSAIVQQAAGTSPLAYARANLFEPLGISDVAWATDPAGLPDGGAGLWLRPHDMAKFGYLYLRQGVWDGRQVIPAAWVAASSHSYSQAADWGQEYGVQGYGYQWWVHSFGAYAARGYAGQRIFVLPQHDLVVVFTAGLGWLDMGRVPDELLVSYIIPAALSNDSLPANPAGVARLLSLSQAVAQPPPAQPVSPLPPVARQISGQTYGLEENLYGLEKFSLSFSNHAAALILTAGGRTQRLPIGLDNLFRTTELEPGLGVLYGLAGQRGHWRDEHTFILQLQLLNGPDRFDIFFTFINGHASVRIQDGMVPGRYTAILRGTLLD